MSLTTITELLAECRLEHLCVPGHTLGSLQAAAAIGRVELLEKLKVAGVSKPPQRSTIANTLSKAERAGRIAPSPDEVPADTPDPDAPLSANDVRNGGYSDGRLATLLRAALPSLQTSQPMPGEARGAQDSTKCFVPQPDACVRLFCLYGVADVAMSIEPWLRHSPAAWLEVRLCDLPGHGFRRAEALPPCASTNETGLDETELGKQRAALVAHLTDEILSAAGEAPFALYGFSFGALVMYGVSLEASRRGKAPICLCVAGRGAAHSATLTRTTVDMLVRSDTERMLAFQGAATTANIPAPMRARAASLFRCGLLLGGAPSGHGQLSSALPDPAGSRPVTSLTSFAVGWDSADGESGGALPGASDGAAETGSNSA